jgi:hypothetical protein
MLVHFQVFSAGNSVSSNAGEYSELIARFKKDVCIMVYTQKGNAVHLGFPISYQPYLLVCIQYLRQEYYVHLAFNALSCIVNCISK